MSKAEGLITKKEMIEFISEKGYKHDAYLQISFQYMDGKMSTYDGCDINDSGFDREYNGLIVNAVKYDVMRDDLDYVSLGIYEDGKDAVRYRGNLVMDKFELKRV